MPKYIHFLSTMAFALSVAWAGTAGANNQTDDEHEAMDLTSMSYVEARINEGCTLEAREDGSQVVVNRDECQETLQGLEEELAGINGFGHELQDVEDFRETFDI